MTAIDISGLSYFVPLVSFLLVFLILFAVLNKTKLVGDNKWVQLFVAFLISTLFIVTARPKEYILNVVPWFAVLLVSAFLILALTGLVGGLEDWSKGVGKIFVVIMAILFLVAAYYALAGAPEFERFKDWLTASTVAGAIILLAITALVSWVLVKTK